MPSKSLLAAVSVAVLLAACSGDRPAVTSRKAPPPFSASAKKHASAQLTAAMSGPQPAAQSGPWPAVSSSSSSSSSVPSVSGYPVSCSDPEWSSTTNDYRFTNVPVTVTFSGGGTVQYSDACANSTSLQEAICGTNTVTWINVTCAYNGTCLNGACQPVSCTDTDPKDDPAVKGSVSVNGVLASSDGCQTSPNGAVTILNQASCLPNVNLLLNGQPVIGPNFVSSQVPGGSVCLDGIVKAGSASSASSATSVSSTASSTKVSSSVSSSSKSSSSVKSSSSSAKSVSSKSMSSKKKSVKKR